MTTARFAHRLGAAVAVLSLSLALGACAGFARPAADADYGTPPLDYADAARAHLEADYPIAPGSRFSFGKPVKAYANNGLALGGAIAWMGYLVDVDVTAPSADGQAPAPRSYMVFFRNGHVVRTLDGREHVLVTRVE